MSTRRVASVQNAPQALVTRDLDVMAVDGATFTAAVSWPAGAERLEPVLVFGELFGLNDVQRSAARRVAAMGYLAVAPDLLHRRAPGGPIPEDAAGRAHALGVAAELTRLEVVSDARAVLEALRELPVCDPGSTGAAVGVSFGGHAALVTTALLGLRACAAMYPGWLAGSEIALSQPEPSGRFASARMAASGAPALVLVGADDPMVPLSDQDSVRDAFAEAGADLELITYPEAGHRFAAEGRPGWEPSLAADAWARVGALLAGR